MQKMENKAAEFQQIFDGTMGNDIPLNPRGNNFISAHAFLHKQ